jgi:hypothetical protein
MMMSFVDSWSIRYSLLGGIDAVGFLDGISDATGHQSYGSEVLPPTKRIHTD